MKVEGIMGVQGWNAKAPFPGSQQYFAKFAARYNGKEADSWSGFTYASCQVWEEVIRRVGLDREKQKQCLATGTFHTIVGPIRFINQYNKGQYLIGQWQDGSFENVAYLNGQDFMKTDHVIYPKPLWI